MQRQGRCTGTGRPWERPAAPGRVSHLRLHCARRNADGRSPRSYVAAVPQSGRPAVVQIRPLPANLLLAGVASAPPTAVRPAALQLAPLPSAARPSTATSGYLRLPQGRRALPATRAHHRFLGARGRRGLRRARDSCRRRPGAMHPLSGSSGRRLQHSPAGGQLYARAVASSCALHLTPPPPPRHPSLLVGDVPARGHQGYPKPRRQRPASAVVAALTLSQISSGAHRPRWLTRRG